MREIALELRYKNIGSASYSESILTDVTVLDAASHSYSIDLAGDTTAGPGFPSDLVNIAPGESADGFVTFQVPTATPVAQVKLGVSVFGGDTGEWRALGRVAGWRGGRSPVSSQPPSNRACGSPAHGSPTCFTVQHAQTPTLVQVLGICRYSVDPSSASGCPGA
jgi:hypothetical protein